MNSLSSKADKTPSISTGVAGVAGVLTSLIRRAENGGSHSVDVSQNQPSYFQLTRTQNKTFAFPDKYPPHVKPGCAQLLLDMASQ